MIANPLRGEVVLVMDDQEHVLRLNLAALMQLEQMLGEDSLVSMVQRFENNAYTSRDVMRVLLAGLWGGGWQGRAETLVQADIQGGVVAAARAAAQLLVRAFDPTAAGA